MKILKTACGTETVVDDDVYVWASKIEWRLNNYGYVSRRVPSGRIFLHQKIVGRKDGFITDHVNGNKLDNLRSNLRIVTNKQNVWNNGIRSDNTSGYRGVYYRKDRNRWSAEIKKDGVKESLGCYSTASDAAIVYNRRARELFGEYARLNNIIVDDK